MFRLLAIAALLVSPPLALAQVSAPSLAATSQPASQPASQPVAPARSDVSPKKKAKPDDAGVAKPIGACPAPPATTAGDGDPTVADPSDGERRGGAWSRDMDTRIRLVRRGAFTLHMGAMIQVQGAFYAGADAARQFEDPTDNEGFLLRRARFGFSGQLLPDVAFYLAVDMKDTVAAASGGDIGNELLDATITWNRYSIVQISAGVDRVPFSAFALQSSSKLVVIERPLMVRLLDLDRRVGVRVSGELGSLDYAVGVFNGSAGVTSGNRLAGLAAAARLGYHILGRRTSFVPREPGIYFGGAYVYDNGPVVNSDRIAVGLELVGFRTKLTSELLWQRSNPDAVPAGAPDAGAVTRWGVAGELSVFVWRQYVQLAGRYEYFRDNEQLIEFGRQQLISAGLNIYLCRNRFKLQANYIRRDELTGPELSNDIAFAQVQAAF